MSGQTKHTLNQLEAIQADGPNDFIIRRTRDSYAVATVQADKHIANLFASAPRLLAERDELLELAREYAALLHEDGSQESTGKCAKVRALIARIEGAQS